MAESMVDGADRAQVYAMGSIALGFVVLALKFAAWWLTGSVALYSDAIESIVNVVAAIIAYLAIRWSAKPADARHPYGHQKIEYVAAIVEGALIILAAVAVVHAAYNSFLAPKPMNADPLGIGLNLVASAMNGAWCYLLLKRGKALRAPALIADGKHLLSDVVSSIGVLVGLLLALSTGYLWLDPAIACLVALNILVSGGTLLRDSLGGLMDEAAAPEDLARIRAIIQLHAVGAIEAHDLRTRHSGRLTFIEFHLVVPGEMRVDSAHEICDRIEAALKEDIGGALITIHVEPTEKAIHQGIPVL
jgi:cation diffusion facilitator family transporter